jgi:hypothetical protein
MDNKYIGMIVNELHYKSGLLNKFDKAIKQKDIDKVITVLKQVDLTELSITPILESHGLKLKG